MTMHSLFILALAISAPHALELDGDAALVDQVQARLDRAVMAAGARVHLAHADARIVVTVEDAEGRISERTVGDVEVAAWLIDSLLRDDLDADLLPTAPPREAESDPGPMAKEQSRVPIRPGELGPGEPLSDSAVAPPPGPRTFAVAVSFDTALDRGGALWVGGSASGCARFDWACVGLIARAAVLAAEDGDGPVLRNGKRSDFLLSADFEVDAGAFAVVPGIGGGIGWNQIGEEIMPTFRRPFASPRDLSFTRIAPEAEVHTRVSIPISNELGIDVGLALSAEPPLRVPTRPNDSSTLLLGRAFAGLRWEAL